MIFSCSKCGTRHQLPDEQVAHRVLKVRCTGCSAIVIVRDPASAATTAPAWFVAIHGQQRGPLSLAEVTALVDQGAISARTYAWHAGLAEWTKIGHIDELAHLVQDAVAHGITDRAARPDAAVAARKAAEAEAARLAAEAEAAQLAAEAEAAQLAADEEAAQLAAEAEAARLAAEAEAAQLAADEEAARLAAEAEAAQLAADEEATRLAAEAEAAQLADEEAARLAAEAEAAQLAAEAEAAQLAADEEAARLAAEAEAARLAAEAEAAQLAADEEAARLADEEAARLATDAAAAQLAADEEAAREAAEATAAARKVEAESAREAAFDGASRDAIADAVARAQSAPEPPPIPPPPPIPGAPPVAAEAPAEQVAAATTEPLEPEQRESTGLAGLVDEHELAFFESKPHAPEPEALDSHGIFAAVDRPSSEDKEFFKRAMKEAPTSAFKERKPSKIEMNMLRQEFSVVAHLERTKKKSWVYGVIGVGIVVAMAVGILIYQQQQHDSTKEDAAGLLDANPDQVYAERKLYETPAKELPEIVVEAADRGAPPVPEPVAAKPKRRAVRHINRTTTKAKDGTKLVVRHTTFETDDGKKPGAETKDRLRSLSPEQFKALMADDSGKGEVKVNFDGHAVQDAAAKEAAAKHEAAENDRAIAVAEAFGKKKRQFASCASDAQERVKVVFSVLPNGNVRDVTIDNTRSDAKADCLEKILGRSIFPRGATVQTYSQTLVL